MVKEATTISKQYGKSCDYDNDFLSKFPDDLLIFILSFLRTEDAVRTSILSKRWRHLWRYIYNVDIYYIESAKRSCPSFTCKYAGFYRYLMNFSQSRMIKNFNVQVQHRCQSTINTFYLDSLVEWAVEHGVEMLVLKINQPANGFFYTLPLILSQCKTLVNLKLSNSAMNLSPGTPFLWPLLKCLSLKKVVLYALDFNNIMCSCSLLERLSLVICDFPASNNECSAIRICSRTLRYLQLWDCKHKDCKITIYLPSLVEVSVNMLLYRNGADQRVVLADVSFVKKLHVGVRCTKAMSVRSFNASTSSRHVQMDICVNNSRCLKGMANLMSRSSNLQTLVIKFQKSDRKDEKYIRMICDEVIEEHLSKRVLHLRSLRVYGINLYELNTLFQGKNNGLKIDMNLTTNTMKIDVVKVLLKRLNYLEKLVIFVVPNYAKDLMSQWSFLLEEVTESLRQFERASPFVHILVSWDHPN